MEWRACLSFIVASLVCLQTSLQKLAVPTHQQPVDSGHRCLAAEMMTQ